MTAAAVTLRMRVRVFHDSDVSVACRASRRAAAAAGFTARSTEELAIAVSEIARNVLMHGGGGEIVVASVDDRGTSKVVVCARDEGPGIADVPSAMASGFSTAGGLGLGLAAARDFVDVFEIDSGPGRGTTVVMEKWAQR